MPPSRVFVTARLAAAAMDRLDAACEMSAWWQDGAIPRAELLRQVEGKAGLLSLLTERVDEELLAAAGSQLRIVANYAVGVDNIDVAACTKRSVMVTNTPDVLTEATADMAWALMLAAARRLAEGDRMVRSGEPWRWGPEVMLGMELHGGTLGIVGYGRIGRAVARRAGGHGMRVVFHDRHYPAGSAPEPIRDGGGHLAEPVTLAELLATADVVSLHVSLNDESRHLVGAPELAAMKPTAILVNTSRGPVVDEEALADALEAGRIFAAGLDVFEHEPDVSPRLLAQPLAVLCPHLGSATVATRLAMAMVAVDNLLAALEGDRPPNLLNEDAFRRQSA